MAPHFRQCHFCSNSSTKSPNVVIFTANEKLKKVLNVSPINVKLICEEHFLPEDVKTHGDTKRLVDGATPKFFPREKAVAMDHDYVLTAPLDLVSPVCHNNIFHIKEVCKCVLKFF